MKSCSCLLSTLLSSLLLFSFPTVSDSQAVPVSQAVPAAQKKLQEGSPAPALDLDHLLQAPGGVKADWAALRGKVVVLEFWATWCAPCIADIPLLNKLADSLDASKVQFIAVDDEEPARVEEFLKKHPISGWVGFDTTGRVFERYEVSSRPRTVIVGPDGRVVVANMQPEWLNRELLLAVVEGRPLPQAAATARPEDAAAQQKALEQAMSEQFGRKISMESHTDGVMEISVTEGEKPVAGKEAQEHVMAFGDNHMEMSNAPVVDLLSKALKILSARIQVEGKLPEQTFNLHMDAAGASFSAWRKVLLEMLSKQAHVEIASHTAPTEVYVLTDLPAAAEHFKHEEHGVMAHYGKKSHRLHCIMATPEMIAAGLEDVVGRPVVSESKAEGELTAELPVEPGSLESANQALATVGLKLISGQKTVEIWTVRPVPKP